MRKESGQENVARHFLQNFGNELRKEKGYDYLAKKAVSLLENNTEKDYVIDSIKNHFEIKFLRESLPNFYLFGIFAEPDIRYERVKDKYDMNRSDFNKDDKRDSGEKFGYGQQVTKCFGMADLIISNSDRIMNQNEAYMKFLKHITEKVKTVKKEIPFRPSPHETYMTMAYAASMRSSCLKRKVGAIIVDDKGTVISSGYNEVPLTRKTC